MSRNLPMLVPKGVPEPDAAVWATVTQTLPLRIKLDGETSALPFTPVSLVSGLVSGHRVWVALATNADPSVRSRRVVILGKADGFPRRGITIRRNTAVSIPNAGVSTTLSWEVEDFDSESMWTSGSTITIPTAGVWSTTFQIEWAASVGAGRAFMSIEVAPGTVYRLPYAGTGEQFITMNVTMPMQAGDTFVAKVFQSSGAALNLNVARLHCYRVSI